MVGMFTDVDEATSCALGARGALLREQRSEQRCPVRLEGGRSSSPRRSVASEVQPSAAGEYLLPVSSYYL